MTRTEREQQIQRYLSGEMTSAQEGDFFIQVALNTELRHDLQAQQTVESAFRKEREAEPSQHTAMRSRVASMLAASSAPLHQTESQGVSSAGETTISQGTTLTRLATGIKGAFAPMQWLIISAVATLITVGAVLVIPNGGAGTGGSGTDSSSGSHGVAPLQQSRSNESVSEPDVQTPVTGVEAAGREKDPITPQTVSTPVRRGSSQLSSGSRRQTQMISRNRSSLTARDGDEKADPLNDKPASQTKNDTQVAPKKEKIKVGVQIQLNTKK